MVARVSPKVSGSRQAARSLHSPQAVEEREVAGEIGGLDDVVRYYLSPSSSSTSSSSSLSMIGKMEKERVVSMTNKVLPMVLDALRKERVTALLGEELEREFKRVVYATVAQAVQEEEKGI
jgi:hypothetical protein